MKNIKIFRLKIEDLRSLTSSFGNSFKFSREYAERHTSVIDDKSNLIQAINDNHAAIMRLHYADAKMVGAVIEQLEKRYPLDFSYYQEFMDKANRVYEANSFFDSALINPFTGVSWEQFKPSPRKRKYVDDFSRNIKILHTSAGKHNSRMVIKHKLAVVKLQVDDGKCEYVPVIKFTLPLSRMTNRTVIVSATPKYEFAFYLHNREMIYIDRSEHDAFFAKHNKSIVTHTYNSLNKFIGMDDVSLKEFKAFENDEREQFVTVSRMFKV